MSTPKRPLTTVKRRGGTLATHAGHLSNGTPTPERPRSVRPPPSLHQIAIVEKADRRRAADKMEDSTSKEWTKGVPEPPVEAPEWRYKVVLNPAVDIDSAQWQAAEDRIESIGWDEEAGNGTLDVVRKIQSRFADIVYIDSRDHKAAMALSQWPEIDNVARMPHARSKGPVLKRLGTTQSLWGTESFYPTVGGACTAAQTNTQASKVDTIQGSPGSVENNGGGVAVIVWDFVPSRLSKLAGVSEFEDRAAGPMLVFDNDSGAIDKHGSVVASVCCGKSGGLATGSNLALLGLTDSIELDLAEIDEAADSLDIPIVVNMSFGLTWSGVREDEVGDVHNSLRYYNDIVEAMKSRHPQLSFIAAAGNESIDPCTTLTTLDWYDCTDCISWPQFTLGEETPVALIGSTEVAPESGERSVREYATYSNYGVCIDAWSHGGAMCGWDVDAEGFRGTEGTSFASPLFASLVALGYSKYPDKTDEEVMDLVRGAMVSNVTGAPSGSPTTFAVVPEAFKTGGSAVVTNPNWGEALLQPDGADDSVAPASTNWAIGVIAAIGAAVVLWIIWKFYKSRNVRASPDSALRRRRKTGSGERGVRR